MLYADVKWLTKLLKKEHLFKSSYGKGVTKSRELELRTLLCGSGSLLQNNPFLSLTYATLSLSIELQFQFHMAATGAY
jgi:hypothetical protein